MVFLKETAKILVNTLVVTVAVILGFVVGGLIGLPIWLQAFCLLPAAFLYYALSGSARPAWWKILGFLGGLCVLSGVFLFVFPHVPEAYQTIAFGLFVVFAPNALMAFRRLCGANSGPESRP